MNGLLCYDLLDSGFEPTFTFPNLETFEPATYTKQVRFSCLSYRKDLGNYEERFSDDLSKEILDLGHETRKEIRNLRKGHKKDVKKLEFRNFINPLSKTKEVNTERAIPFVYVGTPVAGVPISLAFNSGAGLFISIFIPVAAEIARRVGIRERRSKIKEINKKLRQPKVRIFSDMIERKSKIDVSSVLVEPASKYMEKIKDPDILSSVDFNKVNERLIQEYQNFATQPKT